MTWKEYYDKFFDWATSTQIRRLSDLTSYGSPDEITEVAQELLDEKAASRLVNKAMDAGIVFKAENIEELLGCLDEATFARVVSTVQGTLPDEAIEDLAGCMDDDVFQTLLSRTSSGKLSPTTIMALVDSTDEDTLRTMVMKATDCFDTEQLEILRESLDVLTMERLIEKSLNNNVRFSPKEVVDWLDFGIAEPIIEEMAMSARGKFDASQAEELHDTLSRYSYLRIAEKRHLPTYDEQFDGEPVYQAPSPPRVGFWGALMATFAGIDILTNRKTKKGHNGRCNGDCANCPPHYGYRYGRWYYGHCHQHGCEFGGNKGDGSMD